MNASVGDQLVVDPFLSTSQSPSLADIDVLDLDALRHRCMDNLDFVQRILEKFQEQMPEQVAELERLLSIQDTKQLALVAHRIKGTSANVAAGILQHVAAEIEELGRAGRVAEIQGQMIRLHDAWEQFTSHAAIARSRTNAN
jgi:HPt (histidine-containing phosphotransfer) domain-containing protein